MSNPHRNLTPRTVMRIGLVKSEQAEWSRHAGRTGKTFAEFMREAAREKLAREQTTDATEPAF